VINLISGNEYWDKEIINDLVIRKFDNREYSTFKNLKNNMYQVLKENAVNNPDKIGVVDINGKPYTYMQVLEKTDQFASYLAKKYNIKKGSHIALLLYTSIEYVISFLASQKLGAVIIPLPTKYKEQEICSLIEKSNCDLIISDEKYYSWVKKYGNVIVCTAKGLTNEYAFQDMKVDSETEESGSIKDAAIIMFTSGTTSFSKGVVIRNFNIQHAITAYNKILNVNENDSTILAVPIYNVTGLVATLSMFLKCRGTLYLHKFFNADQLLSDMVTYKITFFHASPTIFSLILKENKKFPMVPSLKTLACGSSNMAAEKIKELKNWLPQMSFRTIYGLSETTSPGTIFPTDASVSENIGSSGRPIPGLSIKIVDDSNEELGYGQAGEICLKGTNVIEEYYQQDTGLITEDKWLKTGDIGYFNEEGYLYILDRKKDLINRGGEKIFSFDVENAICQIEGINEVAVVAVKDHVYGEVPAAVISLKDGYSMDESVIKPILKNRLASYEIPAYFYFVAELSKTPNGKIDKKRIRESLQKTTELVQ
jgi:long-chain acyl-CoA synthetase